MEVKYTITGHVPSKKNSKRLVCRGKFPMVLPSVAFQEWHPDALLQLSLQKAKPFGELGFIHLKFFAQTMRGNDLTNKAESINDLLVEAGVIEDDNWHIMGKVFLDYAGVDKANPRVEIYLYKSMPFSI